jgi:curli biogenesis system outer membrane secretion channel CsgG
VKSYLTVFLLFSIFALCYGCQGVRGVVFPQPSRYSGPAGAPYISQEEAARKKAALEKEAADVKPGEIQVYDNVEDKPSMACLEFRLGNKEATGFATTIQEMFCTGFVQSKKFWVVEREQIEKVLKEKQFVQMDDVDADKARRLGKVLGVDYLLIGSVSKLDETFEIDARLVDVGTGKAQTASHGSCPATPRLWNTVVSIVNDLNSKFSR